MITFDKSVLEKGIKKAQDIAEKKIYETLEEVCVKAIKISRDKRKHPYDNYTFNLEQSIACAIYHDGQIVFMDWTNRDWSKAEAEIREKLEGDGTHDNGSIEAQAFLEEYTPTKSWEVVFVAGAEYAQNIQEDYGDDAVGVLWGSFTFIDRNTLKIARKNRIK